MAKISLNNITSGFNVNKINDNFSRIVDHLQNKVLYRNNPVGEPNELINDIDVNGKRLYNLPVPQADNQAARLKDVKDALQGTTGLIPFPASFIPAEDGASGGLFTTVQGAINYLRTYLTESVGSSLVGFVQAGLNAIPRTVQSKLRDTLSVDDFGAVGDGIADDTNALINAEAVAFLLKKNLCIPPKIYNFNGSWTVRVNVEATGATIKQIRPTVSTNNTAGTVNIGADSIIITGLTVDSNLKSTGFSGDGFSYYSLRDCKAINCVNLGFGFYGATRVDLWYCSSSNVRYSQNGVIGGAADGFYFGGCLRSRWIGCYAENFRRIGFVSESSGSVKSAQIQALFCIATNANNCDDSLSEYNSGFWAENTNSIDWLYCIASNIAGNPGQTSGRVVGLWALGGGNNSRGTINVVGCRVFGGSGYLPSAMVIGGSSTYADVLVENCYLNKAQTGVITSGNVNSLTIRNLSLEDIVSGTSAQGGILIDTSGGGLIPVLEIDKINVSNSTFAADSGIINFFSAPIACKYTLRNVKGFVPHVMRTRVNRIRVEECEIAAGSTSYSSFLGDNLEFIDSHFSSRNSSNSDFIFSAGSLASNTEIIFRGGSITGFGSGWNPEISGNSISLRVTGTKCSNFCWDITTTGTFENIFQNCKFLACPSTLGTIRTNFNVPTKQILIVQSNYFECASSTDRPVRLRNTAPTNSILQGNTVKTATAIHNLGAVSSDVNNVYV